MAKDLADETGSTHVNQPHEFWFNTKTLKVEKGVQTAAPFRIGPFATENEAARALEIIKSRSESWRVEEEAD